MLCFSTGTSQPNQDGRDICLLPRSYSVSYAVGLLRNYYINSKLRIPYHLNDATILKETGMKLDDGIFNLIILEHETNVDLGSTLTHHLNLNISLVKYAEGGC
mmetsp:Transcript_11223/g.16329  ORF Transcript_11223/g.16329 Transcript_11223/m.16329 type:complete len:103 (-) Transcript_11223:1522-1830(-)